MREGEKGLELEQGGVGGQQKTLLGGGGKEGVRTGTGRCSSSVTFVLQTYAETKLLARSCLLKTKRNNY